jgi:hypothetical protein
MLPAKEFLPKLESVPREGLVLGRFRVRNTGSDTLSGWPVCICAKYYEWAN